MLRHLTAATVLTLFASAATAFGCEGKQIIFEDEFKDDSGGWYMDQRNRVENSSFVIKIADASIARVLNTTFSVKDADICAEAVWPQGDISKTSVGLVFWAQDIANYFLLQVRGDGTTAIWRVQSNKWIVISNYTPASSVKQAAGDTNVLRAKVKGNLVSFFVNNVKIRDIRGQAPQPDWQFGLFGENQDKEKEIEVRFKHVKVTDAQ